MSNCEQTLNNINSMCEAMINQQGHNTSDIQNLIGGMSELSQVLQEMVNNQAILVSYFEEVNSMIGLPNNGGA